MPAKNIVPYYHANLFLIGVSQYTSSFTVDNDQKLPDIPSIKHNLLDLKQTFTSQLPIPESNVDCNLIESPKETREITNIIENHLNDRKDRTESNNSELILIYYSGHGFKGNLSLYHTTLKTQTRKDRTFTLDALLSTLKPYYIKGWPIIFILDCCNSEYASIEVNRSKWKRAAFFYSSQAYQVSKAPKDRRNTWFTEQLIKLLKNENRDEPIETLLDLKFALEKKSYGNEQNPEVHLQDLRDLPFLERKPTLKKRWLRSDLPNSPYFYTACNRESLRNQIENFLLDQRPASPFATAVFISQRQDKLFSFLDDYFSRYNEKRPSSIFAFDKLVGYKDNSRYSGLYGKIIDVGDIPKADYYPAIRQKILELYGYSSTQYFLHNKSGETSWEVSPINQLIRQAHLSKAKYFILPCEVNLTKSNYRNRENIIHLITWMAKYFWRNEIEQLLSGDLTILTCINIKYDQDEIYTKPSGKVWKFWGKDQEVNEKGDAIAWKLADYFNKALLSQDLQSRIFSLGKVQKESVLKFLSGAKAQERFNKPFPRFANAIEFSQEYQSCQSILSMEEAENILIKIYHRMNSNYGGHPFLNI